MAGEIVEKLELDKLKRIYKESEVFMMEARNLVRARTSKSEKVSRDIYTPAEAIREIDATLKMEGMPLTQADLDMLKEIMSGNLTTDEARQKILSEV